MLKALRTVQELTVLYLGRNKNKLKSKLNFDQRDLSSFEIVLMPLFNSKKASKMFYS